MLEHFNITDPGPGQSTDCTMKYREVIYDVGLNFDEDEGFSVEPFDLILVENDIRVITNDLHANAVQIGKFIDL